MHIICPHCTTSYAINPATLGEAGRTVRCARCKEVWLARPEDALEPAMAEAEYSTAAGPDSGWNASTDDDAPHVESPSIAADWREGTSTGKDDWNTLVRDSEPAGKNGRTSKAGWFGGTSKRKPSASVGSTFTSLTTACAAMGALVLALIVWRADVVRLMPQTASFYRLVGLHVNLRGMAFKDVKVTTETVDGKPVLVIEGMIVGETKKTVDLPRLRFAVRDAQGAEIYAWNTVLDQSTLKPGDHASFKSRLASPPAEGKSIDVRFFNKRDVAGGNA